MVLDNTDPALAARVRAALARDYDYATFGEPLRLRRPRRPLARPFEPVEAGAELAAELDE